MYESKSDYLIQKSCCCVNKSQEKSPIKEISNPMPLDSIFRSDSMSNTFQTKASTTKRYDNECNAPKSNSTFPRTTRNALPQIPIERIDKIDLIMNPVKGSLYQEIADDDKPNNKTLKSGKSNGPDIKKPDETRKQLDLIFVTSRILIGYSSQPFRDENNKVLRSLRHQYKKNLKIFHLNIRPTIEDQDKMSLNTVSSLPFLMPFLDDIYNFLTAVTVWLQKSKKNIVLLHCGDTSQHLCALCVRFIIVHEDMNKRLLRIENLILSDHEANAIQVYEKVHMEKYHTSSLKRYTSTVSNIMLDIIHYQPNLKHLHLIALKNIHPIDRHYEGIRDHVDYSQDLKLRTIYLNIYQNFHLVHTTYKITLNEDIETDRIIYIIDPIVPINGDILIMANSTNRSGFHSIYFRLQFHTCLLHGDMATFNNSELDSSHHRDFQSKQIGLVELHLRHQANMIRDHENMLISNKYFVVKERGSQSKDIFSQLKLLDQSEKGTGLSYTAGPVDGNLYAAIPRPSKAAPIVSKYENAPSLKTVLKSPGTNMSTPYILKKFHNLEREITNAADLISSTSPKRSPGFSDQKSLKYTIPYQENSFTPRVNSMKAIKHQQKSFLPYRKSLSLSNTELPIKQNKDDREYFLSYTNSAQKKTNKKDNNRANNNPAEENTSPYDNLFPNSTIEHTTRYREIYDTTYKPSIAMNESNYELISPTNESEVRNKFLSNLNESRDIKDIPDSINNNGAVPMDNVDGKMNHQSLIYDNEDDNLPKEIYTVLVSRNLWFKPNFSRHDAILHLLDQPVGYFIIRTSTSLSKSLSIVVKCSTSIMNKEIIENDSLEHIRHFIIDYNSEGYKIRGFVSEKYYPDLTRLIYDHIDKKIGLPCRLVLPQRNADNAEQSLKETYACQDRYLNYNTSSSIIKNYNVIYLGSFITKHLSDITAISASVDTLQGRVYQMAHEYSSNSLTKMSLRITSDRIIFTDLNRKMFFRKHCKLEDMLCCEVDPKRRVWSHMSGATNCTVIPSFSPIFGLVSCLTTNTEFSNQTCCQLFLALGYDAEDICSVINQARTNVNK